MRTLKILTIAMMFTTYGFSQTLGFLSVGSPSPSGRAGEGLPWAYWLQSINIQTIVNDTSFQLVVMDYSPDGLDSLKFTPAQIDSVKNSGKYVIAYISIGEAEDYRYYWDTSWISSPPAWLGPVNPDWPGNYKVRFWDPQWQNIIFGYIDTIINQGFDGIYMDIIDGYYYWSVENPEQTDADSLMCQFIIDIRNHVNTVTGNSDFILIPQNGEDVWDQVNVSSALKSAFFSAINGVGVEDVFFPGSLDEDNPYNPDTYRIGILQEYLLNNKQVYSVEYLTDPAKITQYENAAATQNYVPYACTRALDYLCGGIVLDMTNTFTTVKNGTWTDASVWDKGAIPSSDDSIIIKHYVQTVSNITIDAPGYLLIEQGATLCGRLLDLEINCDASFDNYGDLYVDRLLVHGIATNYGYIEFTVYTIISGPCPGGTTFTNSGGAINILDSIICGLPSGMNTLRVENRYDIRFSPNPTHNDLFLHLNLPSSEIVSFVIYNIEGRVIKNLMDNIKLDKGIQEIKFNIEELPPGLYLCQLQINGLIINKKIIKLN